MHSADPDALYAYAFSMHQAGNTRDAVPLYQQLHKQFPDNAEILTLLGIAWLQLENISEGIRLLKQSLNISPNQPVALFNLGDALCTLRHFDEALINYDQAIIFSPYRPEIYNNRAIALNELMRFEEALLSCDCPIALNPYSADAHYNKGNSLNGLKCFNEALAAYESAILLKPDFVFAYNNRVNILSGLNRFEEALISCDSAIELNLDFAEAYSNRGYILKKLNRFEEALISCNCAIKLKPDFADAYCNRSIILIELKKFEEALIDCDNAIVLNPKSAIAYFNKALTQLLLGNYEEGWKLYESRWEGNLKASARVFNQPLWLGDALLSGKTILIYEEQGVGDVIQMCRYLHLLNALGANIILEVRSQLIPLLLTLKGNIKVIEKGDDLPLFDFYCPIMSLPLALKTTVETIPKGVPYLFVDSDKQKIWQGRLGEKTKKRIGFVCSGSATHNDDSKRSILLKFMRPLLNLPFEFHLLQKEISAEDVSVLTEFPQVNIHHENLHDFADTAALVNEMDLVISVDTSVAHLAGALGKSVWILIPWVPDFRWLLDRTDSPWYPTVTLFRQPELGNWKRVIEDVCQRLKINSYEY
jgi:tetratricopeptide (TPR) repeat protein